MGGKRLKAFTVIELLITMMLGAIVLGLSYMYFGNFQKYYTDTIQLEADYLTIDQFRFLLTHDLQRSDEVAEKHVDELTLLFRENEVVYEFSPTGVIRSTESAIDSFKMNIQSWYFEEMKDYDGLISGVEIELKTDKDKYLNMQFYKDYTAESLFSNYLNNKDGH